jgi:threonine/homoserine/homoserine lactone efflux protein
LQFVPSGEHAVFYALGLVTLHCLINMMGVSSIIVLLNCLTKLTKNRLLPRLLKGVTGVVFIGFGAKLLASEAE